MVGWWWLVEGDERKLNMQAPWIRMTSSFTLKSCLFPCLCCHPQALPIPLPLLSPSSCAHSNPFVGYYRPALHNIAKVDERTVGTHYEMKKSKTFFPNVLFSHMLLFHFTQLYFSCFTTNLSRVQGLLTKKRVHQIKKE